MVQTTVVSETYEVTRVLEPLSPPTDGADVGSGAVVESPPAAAALEVASTGKTETVCTTPAGEVLPSAGDVSDPPAAALDTGVDPPPLPPAAAEDSGAVVETGATASADVVPVVGVVPLPAAATPHAPRGLLPGNAVRSPLITSSMGHWMLQEVLGSLSPPIRPGHLSIPASPALQLSMIC